MSKNEIQWKFPDGFWWGSATSGPQAEGDKDKCHDSIYDHWFKIERERFFNEIGPDKASGFYENWKADIAMMKKLGHNSFRPSIQWTRIFKNLDTFELNESGVQFYNNVINELISNGIEPFMNLFHFDMPIELQNRGGWENKEVVDMYARYAKTCFELFGDRVKYWFTFNEPIVPAEGGYLEDFMFPNIVDMKRAIQVGYNTQLASAKAISEFRKLKINGEIGVILNLSPTYPRSQNTFDLKAAFEADLLVNRSFLDPAVHGVYPKELCDFLAKHGLTPETTKEELEIIKNNTVDVLGVNYYQPRRVKAKVDMPNPNAPLTPETFFEWYAMPGRKMNPFRGWEIYPKGMYDIAIRIKNEYKNIKWFVSENGMGVEGEEKFIVDGQVKDEYRINFVKDHLKYLHKGMKEGSNCKGYHLWTFIDCWSWMNAYKNRYGWISLDLATGKRTIKKSGEWIAEVSKNNGF
ncbi:MAG: glycoside hydrolase family 1 protein [Fusobacteriaceae bacterium]